MTMTPPQKLRLMNPKKGGKSGVSGMRSMTWMNPVRVPTPGLVMVGVLRTYRLLD